MRRICFSILSMLAILTSKAQSIDLQEAFPDFIIRNLVNAPVKEVDVYKQTDRFIILNFWGTWCAPCLPEMDSLREIQKRFGKDLRVIALANDNKKRVQNYLAKRPTGVWIAADTSFYLYKQFGFTYVGQSAILDRQRRVIGLVRTDSINTAFIQKMLRGEKLTASGERSKGVAAATDDNDFYRLDSTLQTHLSLMSYVPGKRAMSRIYPKGPFKDRRITFFNVAATTMYKTAFGITSQNQVASRSFTTFKQEPGKNYVRAVFDTSPAFILNRLKWMLLGAVVLLLAISYSFYYLITLLRREKKLSEIKNDFISNITHELKTPVATVSGAIESLTHFDGLADPARTQRYLGIARQELDRLSSLIQEVLQSSLYDQSGLQLQQERFNLLQLIEEVMAAQELAAGSRLHISFNTPGGAVWVTGDRLHLQNALNNVIDNAVKYGGNPVKVMISLDTNEERVTLTVTDDGNGIPEKYLPHIFEKFFRVPQGNRHAVKGYGLGLYYVKQVIEAHRGQCSVISSQQRGTTFTMIIPA